MKPHDSHGTIYVKHGYVLLCTEATNTMLTAVGARRLAESLAAAADELEATGRNVMRAKWKTPCRKLISWLSRL